jgi:hypothetical protein
VIARQLLVLAIPAIFGTLGCYHPSYVGLQPIAADSATGTISITGTAFEQQIVLRSVSSTEMLSAHAGDSAALSRMGGVEVSVLGLRTDKAFYVRSFTAVKVAGSPVVDGILRSDGDRILLETSSGRIQLGNPPGELTRLIGARVWIGGPLDTGPNTFGIIAPAS